jgi:hypothetical protein
MVRGSAARNRSIREIAIMSLAMQAPPSAALTALTEYVYVLGLNVALLDLRLINYDKLLLRRWYIQISLPSSAAWLQR